LKIDPGDRVKTQFFGSSLATLLKSQVKDLDNSFKYAGIG
jgi:hypothetical protein